MQDAFIEPSKGRFRSRLVVAAWRTQYNQQGSHSSLGIGHPSNLPIEIFQLGLVDNLGAVTLLPRPVAVAGTVQPQQTTRTPLTHRVARDAA